MYVPCIIDLQGDRTEDSQELIQDWEPDKVSASTDYTIVHVAGIYVHKSTERDIHIEPSYSLKPGLNVCHEFASHDFEQRVHSRATCC